jgi:VWFA-related protein
VRLIFSAVDQNDRAVPGLQATDFAVVDKGFIVRNFQSFTHSDWTRLKLAIVVDPSESLDSHFQQEISKVFELVSRISEFTHEGQTIISFHGAEPALLCSVVCRPDRIVEQITPLRSQHLTPLFDAIVFASKILSKDSLPDDQKVLIVFSDGLDTISRAPMREAINIALLHDVQIYCIDLGRGYESSGSGILRNLADATGGGYFPAKTGISRAMDSILDAFHTSYVVRYQLPSRAAGFHAVQILPTHKRTLQFRSRSGYYFPDNVR